MDNICHGFKSLEPIMRCLAGMIGKALLTITGSWTNVINTEEPNGGDSL